MAAVDTFTMEDLGVPGTPASPPSDSSSGSGSGGTAASSLETFSLSDLQEGMGLGKTAETYRNPVGTAVKEYLTGVKGLAYPAIQAGAELATHHQGPVSNAIGKAVASGLVWLGETAVEGISGLVGARMAFPGGEMEGFEQGAAMAKAKTQYIKDVTAAITGVNLAPANKMEEQMNELVALLPGVIPVAGDTAYEATGSALLGAGVQAFGTFLMLKPEAASKTLQRVKRPGTPEAAAMDTAAATNPEAAQTVADHVKPVDPDLAHTIEDKIAKYADVTNEQLKELGGNEARNELRRRNREVKAKAAATAEPPKLPGEMETFTMEDLTEGTTKELDRGDVPMASKLAVNEPELAAAIEKERLYKAFSDDKMSFNQYKNELEKIDPTAAKALENIGPDDVVEPPTEVGARREQLTEEQIQDRDELSWPKKKARWRARRDTIGVEPPIPDELHAELRQAHEAALPWFDAAAQEIRNSIDPNVWENRVYGEVIDHSPVELPYRADHLLEEIAKGSAGDVMPRFLRKIAPYLKDTRVEIVDTSHPSVQTRSGFFSAGKKNTIRIAIEAEGYNSPRVMKTLIHEAVHAAVFDFMDNNPHHSLTKEMRGLMAEAKRRARRMGRAFAEKKIKEFEGFGGISEKDRLSTQRIFQSFYGMLDVHEFVAEALSNPQFQRFLLVSEKYATPGWTGRSVLHDMARMIKKMLGASDAQTSKLLDSILGTSHDIMIGWRDAMEKQKAGAKQVPSERPVREMSDELADRRAAKEKEKAGKKDEKLIAALGKVTDLTPLYEKLKEEDAPGLRTRRVDLAWERVTDAVGKPNEVQMLEEFHEILSSAIGDAQATIEDIKAGRMDFDEPNAKRDLIYFEAQGKTSRLEIVNYAHKQYDMSSKEAHDYFDEVVNAKIIRDMKDEQGKMNEVWNWDKEFQGLPPVEPEHISDGLSKTSLELDKELSAKEKAAGKWGVDPIIYESGGLPVTRDDIIAFFRWSGDTLRKIPGTKVVEGKIREYYDAALRTFYPEGLSERSRQAAAWIAKAITTKKARDAFFTHGSNSRREFWNHHIPQVGEFIRLHDAGVRFSNDVFRAVSESYHKWADDIFTHDESLGVKYKPIDNYFPRLFKDEAGAAAYLARKYGKKWGDPHFMKERTGKTYDELIKAGFEPKYTNPEDVMMARQFASNIVHMRIEMMQDLARNGLAIEAKVVKVDGKNKTVPPRPKGYAAEPRRTADGKKYWVHEDVNAVLHNAFDSQGLWGRKGPIGDLFKGMMAIKNTIVPIRLLGFFHMMHVGLAVNSSASMTRALKGVFSGQNPRYWLGDAAKYFIPATGTVTRWSRENRSVGSRILQAYYGDRQGAQLSQGEQQVMQYMHEGGLLPGMAEQDRISGIQKFNDAIQQRRMDKATFHALPAILELISYPMFHVWIPQMKINAFAKDVAKAFQLDPSLVSDPARRVPMLRKLAKSVDNRFGEMHYDAMFWNKFTKDLAILNTLSVGWQMGLLREYGGAVSQIGGAIAGKRPFTERVRAGDMDKAFFASSYLAMTMGMSALMTYAYTGQKPEGDDYFYPRNGEKNPDGTDQRLNTPFYTKEGAAIYKHMRNEGVTAGLTHLVTNKASGVIGLTGAMIMGVDSLDQEFRDPNGTAFQKTTQSLDYLFRDLKPISAQGASQSGSTRQKVMSVAGFAPAPKYVTETPFQGDIKATFRRYNPQLLSFDKAEKSRDVRELKEAFLNDDPSFDDKLEAIQEKFQLTPKETKDLVNVVTKETDPTIRMFKRLEWKQQHRILKKHWDELTEDQQEEFTQAVSEEHPYEP